MYLRCRQGIWPGVRVSELKSGSASMNEVGLKTPIDVSISLTVIEHIC